MKSIEKCIYIVLIIILVGALASGVTYMILKDKNNSNIVDNKENDDNQANDKDNSGINEDDFKEKTYFATSKEYIKLLTQENYEIKQANGTKITGKYQENNEEIIFDNSLTAYKKGDYLLMQNADLFDVYVIYYDSTKYDNFLQELKSTNISAYLTKDYSPELKNQITKIEINDIDKCFKYSIEDESFSCSTYYEYYLKNYTPENCSSYQNQELYVDLFAGSSPECKQDYILKWNYFTFEKSQNKYKATAAFTGI